MSAVASLLEDAAARRVEDGGSAAVAGDALIGGWALHGEGGDGDGVGGAGVEAEGAAGASGVGEAWEEPSVGGLDG